MTGEQARAGTILKRDNLLSSARQLPYTILAGVCQGKIFPSYQTGSYRAGPITGNLPFILLPRQAKPSHHKIPLNLNQSINQPQPIYTNQFIYPSTSNLSTKHKQIQRRNRLTVQPSKEQERAKGANQQNSKELGVSGRFARLGLPQRPYARSTPNEQTACTHYHPRSPSHLSLT